MNYFNWIDLCIRKCSGRIDRIIFVGVFWIKVVVVCVKMYLLDDINIDFKEFGVVLDRMIFVEIKEIINIVIGMICGIKNELIVDVIKNVCVFLKGIFDFSVQEVEEDIEEREEIFKKNGVQFDYLSYFED